MCGLRARTVRAQIRAVGVPAGPAAAPVPRRCPCAGACVRRHATCPPQPAPPPPPGLPPGSAPGKSAPPPRAHARLAGHGSLTRPPNARTPARAAHSHRREIESARKARGASLCVGPAAHSDAGDWAGSIGRPAGWFREVVYCRAWQVRGAGAVAADFGPPPAEPQPAHGFLPQVCVRACVRERVGGWVPGCVRVRVRPPASARWLFAAAHCDGSRRRIVFCCGSCLHIPTKLCLHTRIRLAPARWMRVRLLWVCACVCVCGLLGVRACVRLRKLELVPSTPATTHPSYHRYNLYPILISCTYPPLNP